MPTHMERALFIQPTDLTLMLISTNLICEHPQGHAQRYSVIWAPRVPQVDTYS